MSFYLINLNAEFNIHANQISDADVAVGETDDALITDISVSPSEDNPSLLFGSVELKLPVGLPVGAESSDWSARVKDLLAGVLDSSFEIQELEVSKVSVSVDQQAVQELAEQVAADLHAAWQNENRDAYQVRRKATSDEAWMEKALERAEVVRLTAQQVDDFNADSLQLDLQPGQAIIVFSPEGEKLGVYVDIMNTPYEGLPQDWQEANQVSAQGAAQLIVDSIIENGLWDMEVIAEKIHEQWLEANPWAADSDQGKDFAELSAEDQERDRSVARVVSKYL